MSDGLEIEVALLRRVYPIWLVHLDTLTANFPPPETGDRHQNFASFDDLLAAGDAQSYQMMFRNDLRKMVIAGAHALAYRDLVDQGGEDVFQHLPAYRAETEYENFLFRAVALRDKSYQVWNALNRAPIKPGDVKRGAIEKHLKDSGKDDDFFSELVAIWDDPAYKKITKDRNHGAHQHSHEGIGGGYPMVGRQREIKDKDGEPIRDPKTGEKIIAFGIGGTVGKVDWSEVRKSIPAGVELVRQAEFVIDKYLA